MAATFFVFDLTTGNRYDLGYSLNCQESKPFKQSLYYTISCFSIFKGNLGTLCRLDGFLKFCESKRKVFIMYLLKLKKQEFSALRLNQQAMGSINMIFLGLR